MENDQKHLTTEQIAQMQQRARALLSNNPPSPPTEGFYTKASEDLRSPEPLPPMWIGLPTTQTENLTGNEASSLQEVEAETLMTTAAKARGKGVKQSGLDSMWSTLGGRPTPRGLQLLQKIRASKLTRHRVACMLRRLSTQERLLMGRHITWWTPHAKDGDPDYYIQRITNKLHSAGYLESRWPLYLVLLRTNISNPEWLSYVAVMGAVWDTLQECADEYVAARKRGV